MKKLLALLFLLPTIAFAADNAVILTPGSGVTMRSIDIGAGVQSSGVNLVGSTGASILGTAGTANANVLTVQGIASGTPQPVTLTSTTITGTVAATQSGTWTVQPGNTANTTAWLVTGTGGTFPATQSGTWNITNVSGTISLPTGASTAANQTSVIGTKNGGTAATNSLLAGGIYNATPLTLTDTQGASLQFDVNGYLKTNVTNTNANGAATSANSSPVVIASDQVAVATKAASGAWASGSIASGAVASGAVSSGAYASGSLASGAVVDITNMSVATGAAPPSKAIYLGANTSGATAGLLQGLIQCDSTAIYDASTSGSTELVALTSGRTIYVCGYSIMAGGTVNVKLIYGTGTACATGSNNMTPAFQLTAQAGIVDGSPFSRGLKTASANALCINASTGVAAQAIVYYAKL